MWTGGITLTHHGLPWSIKKKYAKKKVKTAYNAMKNKVQKIIDGDIPQEVKWNEKEKRRNL